MQNKFTLDQIKEIGDSPKKAIAHKLGVLYRKFTPYLLYIIINYTNLGPNVFSVLALIVPLCASALFVTFSPKLIFIGALLHQLGYLFDVLDGQVARLRNEDNIQGAYIDALNHYFNIPLLFIGLALGAYLKSGDVSLVLVMISLSMFSKGSGKYCMFYTIGRRRDHAIKGLDFKKNKTSSSSEMSQNRFNDSEASLGLLKIPWIYPNITLFVLASAVLNMLIPQLSIFRVNTNAIVALLYFYAVSYPILDLIECLRIYRSKKTERMYNFLYFNK